MELEVWTSVQLFEKLLNFWAWVYIAPLFGADSFKVELCFRWFNRNFPRVLLPFFFFFNPSETHLVTTDPPEKQHVLIKKKRREKWRFWSPEAENPSRRKGAYSSSIRFIYLFIYLTTLFPIWISPMGNLGCFPWEKPAVTESHSPTTVHARCFSVSVIRQSPTRKTGSSTCTQMLMHAIAHWVVRTL